MKTTQQLISLFGNPVANQGAFERTWMELWDLPTDITKAIPVLPKRMYTHKAIKDPLIRTLRLTIARGFHGEIKTFDGCFVVRKMRGSTAISRHSWGLALDLNAHLNPLHRLPQTRTAAEYKAARARYVRWSEPFLQCWRDTGWTVGADWQYSLDGMHFQWDNL